MLVLILMWIFRFLYNWSREASLNKATNRLPSFHFSEMWLPGGLAGLLWSIGNVSSILTVTNLGEGVGYSIVQAQMLIAGLWGILWYREIKGARLISLWFLCACVTVAGIVSLSNEHVKT
jgi:glucose uptake protein GlcU